MVRIARPVWMAVSAASALFLFAFSTAALQGRSQSTPPAPAAGQVAPFVGDWVVTTAMGGNQMTSTLSVKTDGGKVSATIAGEGQAPTAIPAIAVSNGSLVLRYSVEFGGTPIPTVMTLTPQGD